MNAFFRDMAANPFLATGLGAGLLASLACGVVGPYVVTRRLVFLAGAIAHIAVGGIGVALYLRHAFPATFGGLEALHGATVSAVAAAVVLALVAERAGDRLDTLIGALWSVGMAVGILLIKLTPGYHTELMSYLFGNLAFVSPESVAQIAVLDAIIVVTALVFHRRFLALCLDAEQARLQGVSVLGTQTALLVLVALTVITLTQVVGLILVIALLSLPAATAGRWTRRLAPMILVATCLCAVVTTVPRILVYGTRVSPEPAIVLAAGFVYLLTLALRRRR